jgi:F0F1-type ATP synthase gamma subunit
MYEAGEFDVCTLFYSTFQSVIAQDPTAQQLIPAQTKQCRRHGPKQWRPCSGLRIRAG